MLVVPEETDDAEYVWELLALFLHCLQVDCPACCELQCYIRCCIQEVIKGKIVLHNKIIRATITAVYMLGNKVHYSTVFPYFIPYAITYLVVRDELHTANCDP